MYAHNDYNESWMYSNEDFLSSDDYKSPYPTSDSDSEQELRDVEELLYSHVHYEPNHLCATRTVDDLCTSDVHVTQLNDGVIDGLDISAASNGAEGEVIAIDAQVRQEVVAQTASSGSNLFSVQLKRKSTDCKTDESDDEVRTKSKKVDTSGALLQRTVESNAPLLNSLDNPANKEIIEAGKQKINQPNKQYPAKKKLKPKPKSSSVFHAAVANNTDRQIPVPTVVLDTSTESSSDVYCCDLSSEELSSDDKDDIKLSNINVVIPRTSDVDALADVLNGLSGMFLLANKVSPPFKRQRLSCDACWEVKREDYQKFRTVCAVLCMTVVHNDMQTCEL